MPPPSELLDRAAFDAFAELFEPHELRDFITDWHTDATTALAAIEAALEREDLAAIGQLAHRTAGGALALGASTLAAACESLRAAAETGSGVTPPDLTDVRAAIATTHLAMLDAAGLSR